MEKHLQVWALMKVLLLVNNTTVSWATTCVYESIKPCSWLTPCALSRRPVIVKRTVIGSNGGGKLSTIFKL